ncbi:MAG: sigma-54 dependent transcriptional regulator [Myxococcota bacterium]
MHSSAAAHKEAERAPENVLLVASNPQVRTAATRDLESRGMRCVEAFSSAEALRLLTTEDVDLLIADDALPSDSGLDLLTTTRDHWPHVPRILISGLEEPDRIRAAINNAAVCYLLPTGWDSTSFEAALAAAGRREPARAATPRPRKTPQRFAGIVGESKAIVDLLELVRRVGPTDSTVLVTGETGSGKELIGRAIHEASDRRDRAFSAVNSAAFPETLLESELFGHMRGSFTGATNNKKGLFEQANTGTVFLDEVAEMPLSMQAKLLRFLQTGEIRPIGGDSTRYVDVRLVAATNKDLVQEVEKGNFREDLYYRLAVIPLHVPPLRERLADVPLLAEHFLRDLAGRTNRDRLQLSPDALDTLVAYQWPGNVRELQNVMERAVALSRGEVVGIDVLPRFHRTPTERAPDGVVESLPVLERRHIIETLERVGWNRKRAAQLLQISTTTLWRRLKEFGIEGKPSSARLGSERILRSAGR